MPAVPVVPLALERCIDCALLQLAETVAPELLFDGDYPYFSSVSPAIVDNARRNAAALVESRRLGRESLVVEVASNDGYLLQHFAERGVPVLGIDPSPRQAAAAVAAGIDTLVAFFGPELARRLAAEGRRADVLLANNVLAHVPDLVGFLEAAALLLADDGVAVFEFPHALEMIRGLEFDTIYHQHVYYFTLHALGPLMVRCGLHLVDVEQLPIHGGSLRVFAERRPRPAPRVAAIVDRERAAGVAGEALYRDFAERVAGLRRRLRALLGELRATGATIYGYGAAAKANTLLNYCGIDVGLLSRIVDRNPVKHGRRMAGVSIPIVPAERLLAERPDYCLLLAWNLADEIIAQQAGYLAAGGRFVVPLPEPRVVGC